MVVTTEVLTDILTDITVDVAADITTEAIAGKLKYYSGGLDTN